MSGAASAAARPGTPAAGTVLFTLASAQFLMTLDSSVMNVSIATVAAELGTTVTGIQTAITMYTLVMASLMITGGRLGQSLGHRRVFALGCVIYGVGSSITALAPNLTVLLIGWSFLEGIGAALIMPAIVALIASNFAQPQRPRAYGLVAASGAIAVAVGPLCGGLLTTYASWRWVFAGEVVLVLAILLLARRVAGAAAQRGTRIDLFGTLLSIVGVVLIVFGVLQGGSWGFVNPKPEAPGWLGLSPVFWLVLGGFGVLAGFVAWERYRQARGRTVLVDPALLSNKLLRGGLTSFFFQYLLQAGLFFSVPLFLSVALGLSAVATGLRILPLSVALLVTAVGVPKFLPHASPRRVVRMGFLALLAGIVALGASLDAGVGPEVVTLPLFLAGLGIGALASQLGSVTVSAVSDEQSAEVGGLQNTLTNLGASVGTALAGAVLISALTTSFFSGIESNPAVPAELSSRAQVELASGVPFVPDRQLEDALTGAGVTGPTATAIIDENAAARLDGLRSSLAVLALLAVAALVAARRLPTRQPGLPERH
ncbi:MFS transporter [Asanoa sp. NPDC049573]|uniref:MFS transporter n=1 Tax=Asanoa sp. NPDC049573 TaxID=3155396 RepID=UPI0034287136